MDNQIVTLALTEQEKFFVSLIAEGREESDALKRAGYNFNSLESLQSRPDIRLAVRQALIKRLQLQDAPRAMKTLRDIMADSRISANPRIKCAELLLGFAAFVAPKPKEQAPGGLDKALSEMTGDEIAQGIEALQRELGVRIEGANVIDGKPIPQATDIFG